MNKTRLIIQGLFDNESQIEALDAKVGMQAAVGNKLAVYSGKKWYYYPQSSESRIEAVDVRDRDFKLWDGERWGILDNDEHEVRIVTEAEAILGEMELSRPADSVFCTVNGEFKTVGHNSAILTPDEPREVFDIELSDGKLKGDFRAGDIVWLCYERAE